jgi:hypothetical protein
LENTEWLLLTQSGRSSNPKNSIIEEPIQMAQFSNDGLKNIVELTSAAAILVGLIFVGLELKQSSATSQADTMQGLLEISNQTYMEIAANSELAELIVRADKSLDDLTESEYLQYRSYVHSDWDIWEHLFYSHTNGTMDDKLWISWDTSFHPLPCATSSKFVWNEIESNFGVEFRAHVNGVSEEKCALVGL